MQSEARQAWNAWATIEEDREFIESMQRHQSVQCPVCHQPSSNPLRDGRCIVCELLRRS